MDIGSLLISGGVGAVIGYVTNAIAIRMLFRPYKAWRIGRFRVPFTPGIIPRQRDRLAASLGRMVSRELFDREALVSHLDNPETRNVLMGAVSQLTAMVFQSSATPAVAAAAKTINATTIQELGQGFLSTFLRSPRCEATVYRLVPLVLDGLLTFDPARHGLTAATFASMERRLVRLLARGDIQESGKRLIARIGVSLRQQERIVPEVLAQPLTELVGSIADRSYPFLTNAIQRSLSEPDIKADLVERARRLLSRAISELNPLQRGLLKLGNYEGSLAAMMPGFLDQGLAELEAFFATERAKQLWSQTLKKSIADLCASPLPALEERYRMTFDELATTILGSFTRIVGEGGLSRLFARLEAARKSPDHLTLATIAGLDEARRAKFERRLSAIIIMTLRRAPVAAALFNLIRKAVRPLMSTPHHDAAPAPARHSPGAFAREKAVFDQVATQSLIALLQDILPGLVEGFNVRMMVESRVAKLDMPQLEGLIIGLVGREFTWINILGGILGFLIGVSQAFLPRF